MPDKTGQCIKKTEFFTDSVRVHYHLTKAYGGPDVFGKIDIPYGSIDGLPQLPEKVGDGEGNWNEEVAVPGRKTIVFMFDSQPEGCSGPWDDFIYGPFLPVETVAAMRREIHQAIERFLSKISGETAENVQNDAERELRDALSGVPRFKDLTQYRAGSDLEHLKSIASDVYAAAGGEVPSDEILREAFIPGMFYDGGIWVARDSFVDSNSILLSPVLVGKGSDVYRDTILGPWSSIKNSTVIGYSIKGISLSY